MPYATNQDVRIHYEVDGTGAPLVLLHGFTPSLEIWYDLGYAQTLCDHYQLVLIDARGHGASDKPHDSDAYRLSLRVADVAAVLDHLRIERAHILGYSMGGLTGLALGAHAPARVRSLLIGGADGIDRYPDQPSPLQNRWIASMRAVGIGGVEPDWDAAFGPWMTPALKQRLLANDAEAFIAYLRCCERTGLVDALPDVQAPCLFFCGTADDCYAGAVTGAAHMPSARLVSFPDMDHMTVWCRSDLVLPHLLHFLAEVDTAVEA